VNLISENFYNPQNDTYASVKLKEIERLANELVSIFPSEKKKFTISGTRMPREIVLVGFYLISSTTI